jgi:hypothetical protein
MPPRSKKEGKRKVGESSSSSASVQKTIYKNNGNVTINNHYHTESEKKKGKKVQTTVPLSGTMHGHFAPASGPTGAIDPSTFLYKDDYCRMVPVPYNNKIRDVILSLDKGNGMLLGGCFHCVKKRCVPMEEFLPISTHDMVKDKISNFMTVLAKHFEFYMKGDLEAATEQRAIIEQERKKSCQPCQKQCAKLSPERKACRDLYNKWRQEACALNNGCCNPGCTVRGTDERIWRVLQGDHIHTINDPDPLLRKLHQLSDYPWWACHGGVEAMQREYDKGITWPCRFCHMLETTSSSGRRCPDPATLPLGVRSGTKEETAQYNRRHCALIKYPKMQFVDEIKRRIGKCATCERPVLAGQEQAFPFDHRDPATKMRYGLAGPGGGVSGLVNNSVKAAALPVIKPILWNETTICRLMCCNCDHLKTHYTRLWEGDKVGDKLQFGLEDIEYGRDAVVHQAVDDDEDEPQYVGDGEKNQEEVEWDLDIE